MFEKRKELVSGGTILKKGKFQSKYIVLLTYLEKKVLVNSRQNEVLSTQN